jgi:hypothetical protein
MSDAASDEGDLARLGTPPEQRRPATSGPRPGPVPREVADPHGATDPITRDEYVGRRHGLAGLWGSIAYWVQYVGLSIYGPAAQSEAADPIERLKRKYGRSGRTS